MYSHDFISSRWKTIGKTRRTGLVHIFAALFSLGYIVFYALVQLLTREYTEMWTAIAAIRLTVIHIGRTVWGLMQLQAYRVWCVRAAMCIKRIGLYPALADKPATEAVDKEMTVNDTLVDNAFRQRELLVVLQNLPMGGSLGSKTCARAEQKNGCKAQEDCRAMSDGSPRS